MKLFSGGFGKKVKDETTKPAPTEYPRLLPTLQTVVGMVTDNGRPQQRALYSFSALSESASKVVQEQATGLRSRCRGLASNKKIITEVAVQNNFEACSMHVTKSDLVEYTRSGKRLDTEQAAAMVVAYLYQIDRDSNPPSRESVVVDDDFEDHDKPLVDELLNDPGTIDMLAQTHMWREIRDYDLHEDPREASLVANKNKILRILHEAEGLGLPDASFISLLQTLRRRRSALSNEQHLTMPTELLSELDQVDSNTWKFSNSYRRGKQLAVPITTPRIISRSHFRKIEGILFRMQLPTDVTARYVLDVEKFIKQSGMLAPRRLEALEASTDAPAIAYSFIAAQRQRQLKVVSDQGWQRFLIKGEGKLLLQNRPDVLTSFEDILVRRAKDLVALTAVACPKGVRDHFSTELEIKERARGICELMERYVRDFGLGNMENLVYHKEDKGGSGRGPVDLYNKLCDELRDCVQRGKAVGVYLRIDPVHKFLAKDIMAWTDGWKDDAFADGKLPGWVEYLARVRAQEIRLHD